MRCDNNILPADNAILANKEEERGRSLNRPFVRPYIRFLTLFPSVVDRRRTEATEASFFDTPDTDSSVTDPSFCQDF